MTETDAIQNALKKLTRLIDEAEAEEKKYYHIGAPELVDMFNTRKLAYKTALRVLEEEIQ